MKCSYGFIQHGIVIYDIKKRGQLRFFVASSEGVKDFLKSQTLKQPNLVQLDKVLHKGLQQCVLKEHLWSGLWWLKLKLLTSAYSLRAGRKISVLSNNPEYMIIRHVSGPMVARLKECYHMFLYAHKNIYEFHVHHTLWASSVPTYRTEKEMFYIKLTVHCCY